MTRGPEEIGYIEAELTLYPPERGGRETAIQTGYRPNWWLPGADERVYASATLEILGLAEIAPGARGIVRLYPFAPELWEHVRDGSDLDLCEGPFVLGKATVTRVVQAAAPAGRA